MKSIHNRTIIYSVFKEAEISQILKFEVAPDCTISGMNSGTTAYPHAGAVQRRLVRVKRLIIELSLMLDYNGS